MVILYLKGGEDYYLVSADGLVHTGVCLDVCEERGHFNVRGEDLLYEIAHLLNNALDDLYLNIRKVSGNVHGLSVASHLRTVSCR